MIECGPMLLFLWNKVEWRGINLGSRLHDKDENVAPPVEKHWFEGLRAGNHTVAQSVLIISFTAAVDSHLSAFVKRSNLEEPVPGAEPRGHDDGGAVRRVHLQRRNTQISKRSRLRLHDVALKAKRIFGADRTRLCLEGHESGGQGQKFICLLMQQLISQLKRSDSLVMQAPLKLSIRTMK